MKLDELVRSYRGQQWMNAGLVALVALLAIANVVQVIIAQQREQLVVLVPPTLEAEMAVGKRRASPDYIRSWAIFVATQLGSISPGNAEFLRPTLAPLLHPRIYGEVMTRLEAELDKIRRDRLSISFEPREVIIEEDRDRVFVHGVATTTTLVDAEIRTARTFEMSIDVSGYRPQINFLNTYEGEPRTARVAARLEAEAAHALSRGTN